MFSQTYTICTIPILNKCLLCARPRTETVVFASTLRFKLTQILLSLIIFPFNVKLASASAAVGNAMKAARYLIPFIFFCSLRISGVIAVSGVSGLRYLAFILTPLLEHSCKEMILPYCENNFWISAIFMLSGKFVTYTEARFGNFDKYDFLARFFFKFPSEFIASATNFLVLGFFSIYLKKYYILLYIKYS